MTETGTDSPTTPTAPPTGTPATTAAAAPRRTGPCRPRTRAAPSR